MSSTVTVKVPGTTANLGAGFDCIGAALTLYNNFQFSLCDEEVKIKVKGAESEKLTLDYKNNLLYQSFVKLYEHIGQTPPIVEITIDLGVPLARGLGSSATAIVGGLVGANRLAGSPLSVKEVMELAIAAEGHPDNVVPALMGNCQLSVSQNNQWHICQIPWHKDIIPVVAIPDFELSTEEARAVLPQQINRSDAIFNIGHMGLLIRGLETNLGDWLTVAMEDKLHQPYRQFLIKGYAEVKAAAIANGAYGMVISGAGPTLLALTNIAHSQAVETAMRDTWQNQGIKAEVRSLAIDTEGAH